MNSLKKGEGVPLLNFEGGPGVLLLNFEGGPGVPLLNFRVVPGPTFKLWGGFQGLGSRGPGPTFAPCRHVSRIVQKWLIFNEKGQGNLKSPKKIAATGWKYHTNLAKDKRYLCMIWHH